MVPELAALPKKERELAIPPVGETYKLGGLIWRVTYRNPGKLRYSAELVGAVPPEKPKNVTLDVKSGEMGANAKFTE